MELQANFELPIELPLIAQSGAVGIGLLRTEFLFMNRETVPDEATQTETYRAIVEAMNGDPVTIRVLDWGGEKDIEALASAGLVPEIADPNPALGMRGIRLLLRRPELLETQFAAILRAALAGPVRVMLPMVTTVGEVRAAREIVRAGRAPAAPPRRADTGQAAAAGHHDRDARRGAVSRRSGAGGGFLRHRHQRPDRLHAGGGPRRETDLAALYDPMHPAVLRLVQFATEAALRMRMPVSRVRGDGGEPAIDAAVAGPGAAVVQHERRGGAAGEAAGAWR